MFRSCLACGVSVLLLTCSRERSSVAAPVTASDAASKTRVVVKVEQGALAPSLDTLLEAELLLAMARQPDLEVISFTSADRAMVRRRVCDAQSQDFAACRARELSIVSDIVVELEPGVVPGTWVLTTALTPVGGPLVWLPTMPFAQQPGETLEDAVARAARLLGRSLGATGLRPGVVFSTVRPAPGGASLATLCAGFSAPWLPIGQLAWQTRTAMRAQVHRRNQDAALDSALASLAEVTKPGPPACSQLAALVSWQQNAVEGGWLPAELESSSWRGNVDIHMRGPAAALPVAHEVGNSFAGAFATHGLTLNSLRQAQDPCSSGPDCIEGIAVSDVRPAVWVLVVDIALTQGRLEVAARLLVPDGEGARAVVLPKIEGEAVTALTPAIDRAVADVLSRAPLR